MFFFSFSWHKGSMKKCQWSIICFFNSKSSPVLVDVNFTWITVQLAAICYWAEIMHGFLRCCGKSLIWGALGYAFLIIQHIISFNFDIFTNKKKYLDIGVYVLASSYHIYRNDLWWQLFKVHSPGSCWPWEQQEFYGISSDSYPRNCCVTSVLSLC